MRGLMIFLLGLVAAAASAIPGNSQRIVGGTTTTIYNYPEMAAMLAPFGAAGYRQSCGGIILNNRSVITAAHCTYGRPPNALRSRIGSTYANSGGVVHNTALIFNHPQYNPWTIDNDISIVRTQTEILFTQAIRAALIAGPTYNVPDNAVVWAAGWGFIGPGGPSSEVLRHVNIYSVNQNVCRQRYGSSGMTITDNMLCSGVLDIGGRDQCTQDSGGPLYHNGVVVGVCSFGPPNCGDPFLPGVNVRISRYTTWINNHR